MKKAIAALLLAPFLAVLSAPVFANEEPKDEKQEEMKKEEEKKS